VCMQNVKIFWQTLSPLCTPYVDHRGKFGHIWVFRYPNNRRIKNISIPSIVWVEENAAFLKNFTFYPVLQRGRLSQVVCC
jgi:hypothetical protein